MNQTPNISKNLPRWFVTSCVLLLTIAGMSFAAQGDEWTQFRGPDGSGTATANGLPATWDSQKNVVWKTELPGPGTSSPVILGNRIFLTCYSGYAESIENPGDQNQLMRHLVCVDRASGALLWRKDFKPKLPESDYRGGNNTRHGYASSTPATDGKRLYVFFGKSGVFGFDLEGNTLWQTDVGSETNSWGSATSPLLYEDLVIVNASIESNSLVALDKKTGELKWRARGIDQCWSSPALVHAGDSREVVLNLPNEVAGFDPNTGDKLWYCEGIPDSYVCPTAISHDGVVFVIGGRKNTVVAVRVGGRGDVTNSHVLWKAEVGSNVTSPVYVNGYLYWFHDSRGFAYCLDAKTGEVMYTEKLEPSPGLLYASVTAADGKLYAPSQDNGTYVVSANPKFEQLAVNQFQNDPSRTNASVVISNNQLILRTDKAVYCIGQ